MPDPGCSEAELDAFVRAVAAECGWRTYHVLRPERGPAGFPDRVLERDGVLAVVELKRAAGSRGGQLHNDSAPSAAQVAWLDAIARVRWVASALWRPGDAAGIREWLRDPLTEPPGFWTPSVAGETTKARPDRPGLVRVNELEP